METIRLGRTGLQVTRTAFGVLPLQRTPMPEAGRILRRAFDAGINYFDTARAYSDSEEKIGQALGDVRARVIIATKSLATTRDGVRRDLETSLRNLRTDYVDILQLHNPSALPDPNDPDSAYAALLEARAQGKVRFFGFTNHGRERAAAAVTSGLFDTLQFPFSYLSSADDLALIDLCAQQDVGVIAMKALAGGLLTQSRPAFAFLRQYANLVPIWGMQRMSELEDMLALDADPPVLDAALQAIIDADRRTLADDFCRACGYCLPCPAEIPIPMAARMSLLLCRMPFEQFLAPAWSEQMQRIAACTHCGHCRAHCPYGLDTPALLQRNLADYTQFCAAQAGGSAE